MQDHPERTEQRRRAAGRSEGGAQGEHLLGQVEELHRLAQVAGKIYAYALATSEENAAGGTVVTAPTCGSSGVVPAVLYHLATSRDFLRIRILRALATAGLFGNIAKTNSSISGAEVGCQGEVGVACAMAAAAACQLFGGTPSQIEYAARWGSNTTSD